MNDDKATDTPQQPDPLLGLGLSEGLGPTRDAVLRELDDTINQTWAGKRKRWAALVRAQDAELRVLTDALFKACGDDAQMVADLIDSQRAGYGA